MEKVKILLIGIGGYGHNYINELTEKNVTDAEIAGICEVMPNVRERYPVIEERDIPVYTAPEEFYKEHKADLAVIATPIHLHYQQIITCLRNGSNVLTEKPVCTSVADAKELIAIEKETKKFVSVGYQLNYSRDVLAMKRDILDGAFGKPVLMKTLHAMSRGERYYNRNNWAGRIMADGLRVNDSPFNNACAHQFQNMTFVLGAALDRAVELLEVSGELYRADSRRENFDTASIRAVTTGGVPIYYYTTHNLKEKRLGPVSEYQFENATIYFGKDFGEGTVTEYVAEWKDGRRKSYGDIDKGDRLQKLYDAIDCTKNGGHPVCTIQCAIPHLWAVEELAKLPIMGIQEEKLEHVEEDGEEFTRIRNLRDIFAACYVAQQMPSTVGARWAEKEKERSL